MSIEHLSWEEIDGYLSGIQDITPDDRAEQHLKACEHCRKKVAEYNMIITEIDNIKAYAPADGFSKSVINRLPDCYQRKEKPVFEFFSITAVLMLFTGALFIFLDDSASLFASLAGIIDILIHSVQNIVYRVQTYCNMEILMRFILYAGIFMLLDLLFYKIRMHKILNR